MTTPGRSEPRAALASDKLRRTRFCVGLPTAIEAADGSAGLKVLRSDARIDLLVTDVGLPGGMNGRQMGDAARVARPDLKVLFITGYADNTVLGNGHLEPGMKVLTKPFVMEALASRIKQLIGRD